MPYTIPPGVIALEGTEDEFERVEAKVGPLPKGPYAKSIDGRGLEVRLFRLPPGMKSDDLRTRFFGLHVYLPGAVIDAPGNPEE